MVVAACTGDGAAQERARHHVDLVGDALGLIGGDIDRCMRALRQEPEARTDRTDIRVPLRIHAGLVERITGQVLEHETVVRDVGVHRTDHVVAVPPGVRDRVIELVAVGLGVAHEVEPMPPEALAEVR